MKPWNKFKFGKGTVEILSVPEDVIKSATPENWEELFDKYLIFEGGYVWKPEVMKDFIRNVLK